MVLYRSPRRHRRRHQDPATPASSHRMASQGHHWDTEVRNPPYHDHHGQFQDPNARRDTEFSTHQFNDLHRLVNQGLLDVSSGINSMSTQIAYVVDVLKHQSESHGSNSKVRSRGASLHFITAA